MTSCRLALRWTRTSAPSWYVLANSSRVLILHLDYDGKWFILFLGSIHIVSTSMYMVSLFLRCIAFDFVFIVEILMFIGGKSSNPGGDDGGPSFMLACLGLGLSTLMIRRV